MKRTLALGLLLIWYPLLAACTAPAPAASPSPPPAASATPFQAEPPTATPPPPTIWLSPSLPTTVAGQAEFVLEDPSALIPVEDSADADLRLHAGGEVPLSRWIYALVAPFPTLVDSIGWGDFLAAWEGGGAFRLVTDPATKGLISEWLGEAGAVETYPRDELLSRVWASTDTFALVPFEQLEPRWKVIALGGVSPLDGDFEAADYPLSVEIGLSGEPVLRDAAAATLNLPSTNRDPERLTTVVVTGVTALTRATAWAIERKGIDWALSEVEPWLAEADVTHVSHEVAFAEDCPPVDPSRDIARFCGQPEQIEVLARLGVDVIELTGNHVMDYGPEALLFTLDRYEQRGWQVYGGGRDSTEGAEPALLAHNGHRFAFLGCNAAGPGFAWATENGPGSQPCDFNRLESQIAALRAEGALPIVTFQWAESYRNWPLPAQAEAFRKAADAGAVIVSGSQAHQPQGFEFRGDSFIHYGPGNLLFDQMWSTETRQEFIDRHVFYEGRHVSTVLLTSMLEEYARLRPMTPEERRSFLRSIFEASGWQVTDPALAASDPVLD